MGSKGGSLPPPPPPPPLTLCCMCGDHGLTQELFRCKVCLVRSQHRYCSDLYPKAESYRACNWCLREEGEAGAKSIIASKDCTPVNSESIGSASCSNISISSSNSGGGGGGGGGGSEVKLHRGAFASQLNKPVKKPRMLDRSTSDLTDRLRSREHQLSPTSSTARNGSRPGFRGKVRRYKLLEEVSS